MSGPATDAPPRFLYTRGTFTSADDNAIAIVGSRQCTSYGRRVAEQGHHNQPGEDAKHAADDALHALLEDGEGVLGHDHVGRPHGQVAVRQVPCTIA